MIVRQVFESARQTLVLLTRSRLVRWLAAGSALLALASLLLPDRVIGDMTGDELFGIPTYFVVFQFALPTVLTYLGLAAVHDEIADRSVVHVFALPVHRPALMIGKWVAVTSFGALATAAACAIFWLALAIPDQPWRRGLGPTAPTLWGYVAAAALAAPGYAAVGVFCGARFSRPLIAAILFVVGWEVVVSNLPPQAGVRGWTVADPVRRFLLEVADPAPGSPLSDVLQATLRGSDVDRLGDPLTSVAWFTGLFLVLACVVYTRREYDARARD